jgi:hypothetical protein
MISPPFVNGLFEFWDRDEWLPIRPETAPGNFLMSPKSLNIRNSTAYPAERSFFYWVFDACVHVKISASVGNASVENVSVILV